MLTIDFWNTSADARRMDTSLYVLRNEATTTAFRHDTLDDALAALNYEIGDDDLWVLFELDRSRVGTRRVAEGHGRIKRPEPSIDATGGVAFDEETAYHWRKSFDRHWD
jgi:hypothetical protein